MKYKLSKNLFVMLIIVFSIGSFMVGGQSLPELDDKSNFEEIATKLDANNEFTFDLSAGSTKAFSLYGNKFELVLRSVKLYEGDEWNLRGQPSVIVKFYSKDRKSTIGGTVISGKIAGGPSFEYINDEKIHIYSTTIKGFGTILF